VLCGTGDEHDAPTGSGRIKRPIGWCSVQLLGRGTCSLKESSLLTRYKPGLALKVVATMVDD